MKRKKGLLGTVRIVTALFFLFLTSLIFFSELSLHRRSHKADLARIEADFYREEKDRLKSEVERILERVEFQKIQIGSQTETEVKSRALEGYALAEALYESGKGFVDRETLKREILESLRGLTYHGGEGYYFVLDRNGTVHMNRGTPERESLTLEMQDSRGRSVVEKMVEAAGKKPEGDFTYDWYKPEAPDVWLNKRVYYKTFEPYGWIIGTGLFEADISRNLKKNLLESMEYVFSDTPWYIFAGDWEGNMLLGPAKGRNFLTGGDTEQEALYREYLTAAQREDFLEYNTPDSRGKGSNRLCYLGKVEDWDWFIGAEVVTDELNKEKQILIDESKRTIRRVIIHLSLISVILGVVLFSFFKIIERFFDQDMEYFSHFFKQASTDDIPMEKERLRFREFYDLGDYANKMVKEKKLGEREKQKHRNLESLSFLAAGIAHDFNNALMGIFGNIELAQLMLETNEDPRPYLDTAVEAMDYTKKITSSLLTFAEGGHPNSRPLSLKELLAQVEEQWMDKKNQPEITIVMPEGITLLGDRDQLVLAFTFILNNAYEAMNKPGSLIIRAERTILSRAFSTRLSGDYVKVDIIDRGKGMDEETLEKVFDPYFSTKEAGRGLGLPTVFSIMKHHRGYIDIQSAKGEGTTVTLYIPDGSGQTS